MSRLRTPIGGLAIALVLVLAAAGFIAVSDRVQPFSESLELADTEEEQSQGSTRRVLRFGEDERVRLSADVRVEAAADGLHRIRVMMSHSETTHLDSVQLAFTSDGQEPPIAFQRPGGSPWEPVRFQRVSDEMGERTVFDAPDLGMQGSGTVVLEFLVGPYLNTEQQTDKLWLDFNAMLSENGSVQLTAYQAESQIALPVPNDAP